MDREQSASLIIRNYTIEIYGGYIYYLTYFHHSEPRIKGTQIEALEYGNEEYLLDPTLFCSHG